MTGLTGRLDYNSKMGEIVAWQYKYFKSTGLKQGNGKHAKRQEF